jgi:hypothetical protein
MHKGLLGILLVAAGCRQLLELEPARLEPVSDAEGDAAANGGEATTHGGDGSVEGPGGAKESGAGGGGSPSSTSAGGMTSNAGGSGSGGGTAQAGVGGEVSTPEPTLCEQYCGALEANCTGDLIQYSDYETCLDTCALLPPGQSGDQEVNSVYCRLAEAENAGRLEPEFYCPLAGPASYGKCGASCDAFCDIMMGFCTSESTSGYYFYEDEQSCLDECAEWPLASEPYSAALHTTGSHFECRLFHACASNIDAEYHCGHAFGDPPCN